MDDNILALGTPNNQPGCGGPFSPSALADSAIRHLREQAEAMTARSCSAEEIAVGLVKTAELWRARGADLSSDAVEAILPSCKIIPTNTPLIEQVRRAYTLAAWLYGHAETVVAGLIVDAAQTILLAQTETDENELC